MDKREMHIYMGQAYNLAYNSTSGKTELETVEHEALKIFESLVKLHTALDANSVTVKR